MAERLAANQKKTGIKLLWGTANLFSHPRYACGAGTNPDYAVFAYAGAQVKKAMEVTYKLGGTRACEAVCVVYGVSIRSETELCCWEPESRLLVYHLLSICVLLPATSFLQKSTFHAADGTL